MAFDLRLLIAALEELPTIAAHMTTLATTLRGDAQPADKATAAAEALSDLVKEVVTVLAAA